MRTQTRIAVIAGLAATLPGALLLPRGVAAAPDALASATLVQLTEQDVPPLNLTAYAGTYGRAVSNAVGDVDPGDFSDPDNLLSKISIATMTTNTSATASKYFGQAQLTAFNLFYNSRDLVELGPAGSVGSMDSYAECVPPPIGPIALAYNRTDASQLTILGRPAGIGTNVYPISGADLGLDTIGPSTLTAVVTSHQDPAVQSFQATAEAWLDVDISAVLNDTSGTQVYSGPILHLRLGEVHADCAAIVSPSPSASVSPSASASPSVSASPSASVSPSPGPSMSINGSPSPSPSAASPSPSATTPAPPVSPSGTTPAPPVSPTSRPPLPITGSPLGPLTAAGLGTLLAGSFLLYASRRRRH